MLEKETEKTPTCVNMPGQFVPQADRGTGVNLMRLA